MRAVAPPEAPWPGLLVHTPQGEAHVLVDADVLEEEWAGWDAAASGHLLSPCDIVRRADGHDVALPHCVERADAFLVRRRGADAPLSDGECLTCAVSLLRGAAECAAAGIPEPHGTWWLTDAGRPVLATGATEAGRSTAELLAELGDHAHGALRHAILDVRDALDDRRALMRDVDRLEASLFAVGEPAPLATTMLTPQRARTAGVPDVPEAAGPERRARWADLIAAHVDGDIADAASQAVTSVWRRLRRPTRSRRAPWVLAAGIVVVVVGAGLMWPGGGVDPAGGSPVAADAAEGSAGEGGVPGGSTEAVPTDAAAPIPSPGPPPEPAPAPAPAPDPGAQPPVAAPSTPGGTGGGWVDAAEALLAARTACAGEAGCLATVAEDPARVFPAGAADLPGGQRSITLLDEYGGAAVVRVDATATGATSQLVVLVLTAGKALLRDIHDVAEQGG
ncbi:hypothetical protein CVS47_01476 [Microbacterium lemovicicum]|uniref:Uncharacterized protein n=2 Tax=Microbacterium lemovicicum TaxID=1072463 RepID=A0A3Q9IZ73_9MICO|nr:hypothetical protein CVS47_01455 [Microbacterium lemovicicum]AZS36862.1 hypothetical protein CVS47_01476 [Microbacterium lemovicicum]